MASPVVSALVLNWNGAHLLPDCLTSLAAQDWPALEVLVADNGSVDDSEAVARAHGVRWLPMGENLGFSLANNQAARQAQGDQLFIVNNDMRFLPDCVSRLALTLDADASLFAADPTQLDWDGRRVIHGRTRFVAGTYRTVVVPPFAVEYTAPAEGPVDVPWGCAGSLLVRRKRFEALGGFDPTFFIDFEDADLCWRAWRRGWRTVYVPDAVLRHKVGMSGDEYHHLIRGIVPGRIPKLWFRRRISYHTNLLRFALKCLPLPSAASLARSLVARAVWHASAGRLKLAAAIAVAFARNVARLADTWSRRQDVASTSVVEHEALLRKFGGTPAPSARAPGLVR